MGWWSAKQEQRQAKREEQRQREAARLEAEQQREAARLAPVQEQLQERLGEGEQVLDFLEGTYWDAEHYIAEVVDRPEGIFNMWDSRYVKKGSGRLVLSDRRIMFVPTGKGDIRGGSFVGSPSDRSVPTQGPLKWLSFDAIETIDVPEKHCFMVCFDGRSLPKYDRFGFFATNSPSVSGFEKAVATAASRARRNL